MTTQSLDAALLSDVNRTNYTALIGEFYADFEHVSENYLMTSLAAMTSLAVLGIVLNTLCVAATCRDTQTRRMSRCLHSIFYVTENLFLAGYVGFLQLRGHERRHHHDKEHDLEVHCNIFTQHFPRFTSCFLLHNRIAVYCMH